ncbi:ras-GEF domain-containing family member 1B-like [Macrosteles quadrilineatus]|uniref:ras-GEF domain-containing family member 1B-like n=1 Tax=Macrosteles quadrilineatus TaxID=74068 RepID=UPI0023E0B07B|nr:ras-GEF domain-containing family member 1B-like [Macrosteles quadrilineatus]
MVGNLLGANESVVLAVTPEDLEGRVRNPDNQGRPPPYHESEPTPPLLYEEGHLVSGTLEALTGLLVPTTSSYPDRGYLFAFLLSSRLFVLPHELLTQVLAACHAQQTNLDKPSTAKERLERIMPPMVKLLEEWTDMFPYDFRDEAMTAAVRGITQGCDCVPWVCDDVSRLLQTLLARLAKLDKFEHQLTAQDTGRPVHDRIKLPARK